MEKAKERMNRAEQAYISLQEENRQLEEMYAFLQGAKERKKPLETYYSGAWLDDYTALGETGFTNEITNEDAIFDALTTQYEWMKKILRVCAEFITEDEKENP